MKISTAISIGIILCVAELFAVVNLVNHNRDQDFPVVVQAAYLLEGEPEVVTHFVASDKSDLLGVRLLQNSEVRPDGVFICKMIRFADDGTYSYSSLDGCEIKFTSKAWMEYRKKHPYSATRDVFNQMFPPGL